MPGMIHMLGMFCCSDVLCSRCPPAWCVCSGMLRVLSMHVLAGFLRPLLMHGGLAMVLVFILWSGHLIPIKSRAGV